MKLSDLFMLAIVFVLLTSNQPSSPGQAEAKAIEFGFKKQDDCPNGQCGRVFKEETFRTEAEPVEPEPVEVPPAVEAVPPVEQPEQSILTKQTTTSKQGFLKRVCKRCFNGKLKNRPGKLLNFRGRR